MQRQSVYNYLALSPMASKAPRRTIARALHVNLVFASSEYFSQASESRTLIPLGCASPGVQHVWPMKCGSLHRNSGGYPCTQFGVVYRGESLFE
jgi:hypothetical protein